MFAKSSFIYDISQGSPKKVFAKDTTQISNINTSSSVSRKSRNTAETAEGFSAGMGSSGTVSQSSTEIVSPSLVNPVLEGFGVDINREQSQQGRAYMNKMYRDMYYHDNVCGTAVDLISTLPFSDFTIEGSNAKQTKVYQEACDNLKVRRIFPSITLEHLVVGAFIGSLEYNKTDKIFNNIIVHDMDYANITPSFYIQGDPEISIKIPTEIQKLFNEGKDKPELYNNIGKDNLVKLNKEDTLFIPRRALIRDYAGVSYFRRALAVWLIEKAHMRGQIDQSFKRQRPIAHITVGDGVEWIATAQEISDILQNFMEADLDPLGAYVGTRPGVNFSEVRNGADYFKWTDIVDSLKAIKLTSLGLSENFLSAEASYATLEQSLSVTMEKFRDFRYMMEREVLYDKVFLRLATDYNFKKSRNQETADATEEQGSYGTVDHSKYDLPKTIWQKRLMPESDDAYLQILTTLEEKGVPISMRAWAAAGGFNIDSLLKTKEDDIRIREQLSKWKEEISKFAPKQDADLEEASFSPTREVGLANRDYDDELSDAIREPIALDYKGKRTNISRKGRKLLTEKVHNGIASSMSRIAQRNNYKVSRRKPPSKYIQVTLPEGM